MLRAIFAPVVFHERQIPLLAATVPEIDFSNYLYYHWEWQWSEKICFNRTTIWCPPPELGRQLLTFLMNMWVERPYTTSALIIIPRTCSASYWGLSSYIHHKCTIYPAECPWHFRPVLPIPIELLYISPHVASLPPSFRRKPPPNPKALRHREEADEMRGLPPIAFQEDQR